MINIAPKTMTPRYPDIALKTSLFVTLQFSNWLSLYLVFLKRCCRVSVLILNERILIIIIIYSELQSSDV